MKGPISTTWMTTDGKERTVCQRKTDKGQLARSPPLEDTELELVEREGKDLHRFGNQDFHQVLESQRAGTYLHVAKNESKQPSQKHTAPTSQTQGSKQSVDRSL